jgi:hypothetical protein
MQDLYSWTDYSEAAIGMTYRDQNNTTGVPVDGTPDSLVPITTGDITAGKFAWQQLSGPQGTVSTVIGSETDIDDPDFGSYYLDDLTPTGAKEVQCGGDGKSIGASGFGILGMKGIPITPNTDPRDPNGFNNLKVQRTRYFGPPSDGASQAGNYAERVEKPLEASASASPITGGPKPAPRTKLRISLPGRKAKARPGKAYRLKVRIANRGDLDAKKVKVCLRGSALRRHGACRVIPVPAGKAKSLTLKVKLKPAVKRRKLQLKLTAKAPDSSASKRVTVQVRKR